MGGAEEHPLDTQMSFTWLYFTLGDELRAKIYRQFMNMTPTAKKATPGQIELYG